MRGPGPAFFLYETSLKKTRTFGTMKLEAMFSLCPKV